MLHTHFLEPRDQVMVEVILGSTYKAVERGPDLTARIDAIVPGDMLAILGLSLAELKPALVEAALTTYLLQLDLTGGISASSAIGRILDDLADLAAAQWPHWKATVSAKRPAPFSSPWRRAATRFVLAGRRPRFARIAREAEFAELLSVLPALVLIAGVDALRHERAAPIIAALEWCSRRGARVAALLDEPPAPEPPWDRLLHRALSIERSPSEPVAHRLMPQTAAMALRGSIVERRMRKALRSAPDLSGLFEDEVTLQLGPLGPTPRVDLLWREGKVVVELDGFEHERPLTYGADRHRDYELLMAGYLVLRLTNAEVELDLERSVDKVRSVVNLRRGRI